MSAKTVIFRSGRTGGFWAKSFKSESAADRAIRGLAKVGSSAVSSRKAKGFKFGKAVAAMNRSNKGRSYRPPSAGWGGGWV